MVAGADVSVIAVGVGHAAGAARLLHVLDSARVARVLRAGIPVVDVDRLVDGPDEGITRVDGARVAVVDRDREMRDRPRRHVAFVDRAGVAVIDHGGCVGDAPWCARVGGAGIAIVDVDRLVDHPRRRDAGVFGADVAVVEHRSRALLAFACAASLVAVTTVRVCAARAVGLRGERALRARAADIVGARIAVVAIEVLDAAGAADLLLVQHPLGLVTGIERARVTIAER
jgi:hypothetical protein